MTDFSVIKKNLTANGFTVNVFSTGKEASAYLNSVIDKRTVGFGGSGTLDQLGIYDSLCEHNRVFWHWKQEANQARTDAMTTEIYLCSANAVSETGEIVNIDCNGNRVASMLFGHKKLYIVIGKNKITPTYESAVERARNISAPKRAKQTGAKPPCAAKGDRCYNCRGENRICRAMVTLWGPSAMLPTEVILIDEDLGL